MRKKIMMTLLGVLSACCMAFADDQNYSGTVVTAAGEPIMGATVTVTGTTVSTITDMDGKFSLVVPDGYSTVTITYSGMKKQVVAVQREPIMLYSSAEAAEAAKVQKVKPLTTKRLYKKNAFNLELSGGSIAGCDVTDGDALEIDLGYKHNFSQYIGWHVLDVSATWYIDSELRDYDSYYSDSFLESDVLFSATTGIILRTPRLGKISLFGSLNGGVGYDLDGDIGSVIKARAGINFGKWFYLAYKYTNFTRRDVEVRYFYDSDYEDVDLSAQSHMVTLGFNF